MKPLRIIALLDGRPGHEKQTLGIVRALQAMTEVHLTEIQVDRPSLVRSIILTLRFFLSPAGEKNSLIARGDLLIGTGSGVHLLLLLYKKRYGIPAVTCMAPAGYLRPFFDLCFIPEHDSHKKYKNVFFTRGAPNCASDRSIHQKDRGLILLGGIDEASHNWDSLGISMMVEEIVKREKGIHWTISSSPRTPAETVCSMQACDQEYENCSFFDYRDTPRGWVEQKYDQSSVVWVTSDSISMLYEALTAGCNVGLLGVEWKDTKGKFKCNEEVLLRNKLAISFREWERGEFFWPEPGGLNEAQRCAERMLQTWWPENLQ